MPKASIVVPAFNVEATLADTLRSLLAQSYDDFEIVIVDDGSFDRTKRIAASFTADARVRIVTQANRGLAGARNTGIAESRGIYVGFCDADDLWHPEKLAIHVRHLDANPKLGLSYSGSSMIDEAGRATGLFQKPRLCGITAERVFLRNPVGNGSAAVLRRAALDSLAWRPRRETRRDWVFDETYAQSEDIECWLRLALTTDWEIEGVKGALTYYRVNSTGLSAGVDRQLASWERMVTHLAPLAPAFFEKTTPAARAYQLRYLARRAVSARNGMLARGLMQRSLRSSWHPLRAEPAKTLSTWAAALALSYAGPGVVDLAETTIRRLRGA